MALVGTETSSLLEILEGSFGHVDLETSITSSSIETSIKKSTMDEQLSEKTSETAGKTSVSPSDERGVASAELVFPVKSTPLIIAGLPKSFLQICGLETLSCHRYQYPSCTLEFSKKQLHATMFTTTISA